MSVQRIAALDIGGTRIKACLFENETLLQSAEADTPAKEGAQELLKTAGDLLEPFLPFEAVGVSTAGQVDPDAGTIRYANENLPGYTGTDVRGYFQQRFSVPCAVMNDAYAAALGEGAYGAARGHEDYLCITYGTGIGGGMFLNGSAYYGKGGSANPMIGGLILHPEQHTASDPFSGTYERCASTTALVALAQKADPDMTNGRKIFAAIERPEIRAALEQWLDEVAAGLLSLLHVTNVPCLILGGGILEQPLVLAGIQQRVRILAIPGFENVVIRSTELGNKAGLYGALANARKQLA